MRCTSVPDLRQMRACAIDPSALPLAELGLSEVCRKQSSQVILALVRSRSRLASFWASLLICATASGMTRKAFFLADITFIVCMASPPLGSVTKVTAFAERSDKQGGKPG